MRRLLFLLEAALILTGIGAAAYCVYVWMDSRVAQDQALRELSEIPQRKPSPDRAAKRKAPTPPPPEGSPVGEILIPSLDISVAILEGTQPDTLRRAVGHVAGTPQPGEKGNICLAGHRDTFFRPLRKIAPGDEVDIKFPGGTSRYRVEQTETVDPHDLQVLDATRTNTLTLITCYPFYFIGSAPKRFIVHAKAL